MTQYEADHKPLWLDGKLMGLDNNMCDSMASLWDSIIICVTRCWTISQKYLFNPLTQPPLNTAADGHWESWGAWTACTDSCGTAGVRTRTRNCAGPDASNGGVAVCPGRGEATQTGHCALPDCFQCKGNNMSAWVAMILVSIFFGYEAEGINKALCVVITCS